jgi:CheY-like chemotaxis protein
MTRPPPAPLRVLYVEDNRVCALLFAEALRDLGAIELRLAEDGREAMTSVVEWTPDVLVLDAHLPDCTGLALLQELRRLPALGQTPAYMCSADAAPDDVGLALAAGCAGYWIKPLDAVLLRERLAVIAAARS